MKLPMTSPLTSIHHTWAWQTLNAWWVDHLGPWNKDETATLVIVLSAVIAGFLINQMIERFGASDPVRRRRLKLNVRNTIGLITLLMLFGVWMVELKTFALSIAALVTATVIAFKEPISSIVGSLLTITRRTYSLGDRIEINGHQGEVLDKTLLTTTILENGGTRANRGVVLVIPNNWFLVHALRNYSHLGRYRVGDLKLVIPAQDNPFTHRAWLDEAAHEAVLDVSGEAQAAFAALPQGNGVLWPDASPEVDVVPVDHNATHLLLRYPCVVGHEDAMGQRILQGYWDRRAEAQEQRVAQAQKEGTPSMVMHDVKSVL